MHLHTSSDLDIDYGVNLKNMNTFGLPCIAQALVRIHADSDVRHVLAHPVLGTQTKWVLGGGSNVVLTQNMVDCVLKVEVPGFRCVATTDDAWIIEVGAGESWHDTVKWCLDNGYPGLENMALIPGSTGAAPVQNIGAYGLELKDRLDAVDMVDLVTGQTTTLRAADCDLAYRHSIFKTELAGKAIITRVRLRLPRPWQPELGYADLQRKMTDTGIDAPTPMQIFDWVCEIRKAKLPDPAVIGNAGSFFKNPLVTEEQCRDIIGREPEIVHYPMEDGSFKLAAGWLIDACGWKGKAIGQAGVYEKQALVLVNKGGANGQEVVTLARAIQESVYGRFGIRLEPEPVIR